jgi:hypothetical protein
MNPLSHRVAKQISMIGATVGCLLMVACSSASSAPRAVDRSGVGCHRTGERIAHQSPSAALLAPQSGLGSYYACWKQTGRLTLMDTETGGLAENSPFVHLGTVVSSSVGLVSRATDHPDLWLRDSIVVADARAGRVYRPPLPTQPRTLQGLPPGLLVTALRVNACGTSAYVYRLQNGVFFGPSHIVVWQPSHTAIQLFEGHYDHGTLRLDRRVVSWSSHGQHHQIVIPTGLCR